MKIKYDLDENERIDFYDPQDFGLKFDPDTASSKDLNLLADHIESYMDMVNELMIIPEELKHSETEIKKSIELVNELIKKLRKNKKSVFKNIDD